MAPRGIVVKATRMDQEMQDTAVTVAQDAIKEYMTEQEIASAIKQKFEGIYHTTWHCFVGRDFGCYVTHQENAFIYFYVGQLGVCLFATV
mmetsp:Transcript_3938/g.15207  ORF Transcript_3938/g.15207 Transcript_3938/m.15207 type:complete len:90 (-) Transcript_3938:213-482(-)